MLSFMGYGLCDRLSLQERRCIVDLERVRIIPTKAMMP